MREQARTFIQYLYPQPIRIRSLETKDSLEDTLGEMDKVLVRWLDAQERLKTSPDKAEVDIETTPFFQEQMQLVAVIATGMWRLRQRLVDPETGEPLEEARRAFRHFQSVWDAIHEAGFTIQDHTDQPFDHRLALKVVTYEKKPGIQREFVSETVKPSVYFRRDDKEFMIQWGEVIVATPEEDQANS